MLRLILKENFFHFSGKHYLQNHETAISTKTAVLIALPMFSWHILKQRLYAKLSLEQQFGIATYTISFPYGTWVNQTSKPSLKKQAYITQQLNSRPKRLTLRLRFETQLYTKAQDSRKNLSLIQRHILNKRKASCTHISPRVTLQMLKKEFVKGEALWILRKNSSETTFEENNSN